MHGIPVFTDDGERVGQSTSAARKAIFQVVVSRVFMATPGMRMFFVHFAILVYNSGLKA